MLYPSFVQKIIAMFKKNNGIKVSKTANKQKVNEVASKHYRRGCFMRLPGEHTKFFATQREAAKFLATSYGVEVKPHAVWNALARGGVVHFGRTKAVLARVSYTNDIPDC